MISAWESQCSGAATGKGSHLKELEEADSLMLHDMSSSGYEDVREAVARS